VDTRTHTPVRPNWAERARTVLAAAASASVLWDGGRVDLLGCHHDDPLGDVILTLESTSALVRAVREAVGGDLAVTIELTELCAVSARERVRARVTLAGRMSEPYVNSLANPADSSASLLIRITDIRVDDGEEHQVSLADYRAGEPDPLHLGAAEQLQHLAAHHPDAITTLSRLCDREVMIGVTRILPIALDRYGIVLRVERVRDHGDVRLPFQSRIDTGTEAATQIRQLLAQGARRRPCGKPATPR
jgi:hypothetical protein